MKTNPNDLIVPCDGSLTKREYFAAMAMQGLVANSKIAKTQNISATAVILADALIEELNKESE